MMLRCDSWWDHNATVWRSGEVLVWPYFKWRDRRTDGTSCGRLRFCKSSCYSRSTVKSQLIEWVRCPAGWNIGRAGVNNKLIKTVKMVIPAHNRTHLQAIRIRVKTTDVAQVLFCCISIFVFLIRTNYTPTAWIVLRICRRLFTYLTTLYLLYEAAKATSNRQFEDRAPLWDRPVSIHWTGTQDVVGWNVLKLKQWG